MSNFTAPKPLLIIGTLWIKHDHCFLPFPHKNGDDAITDKYACDGEVLKTYVTNYLDNAMI